MICSRGLDIAEQYFIPDYWNRRCFKPLSRCVPRKGDIYFYDRHDRHLRGLEFSQFIDTDHWNLVRLKLASIVIDFSDDFFNVRDIELIAQALVDHKIPESQIYMLVMDPLWTDFARRNFARYNLKINIAELPWLLYQAVRRFPTDLYRDPEQSKRFSLLSRNYRPWRLELMLNLLQQGVNIQDPDLMVYSFHRYEPYQNITFSHKDLKQDAAKLGFDISTHGILRWIKGVPYDLGSTSNKYFTGTYGTIINSDIHVLVESHWNPYQTEDIRIHESDRYAPDEWAPSFLTEKFYKAILCARPFIVVSTPYFLRDIHRLGYRTFPQLVEEHYDTLPNDAQRSRAIAREIHRLSTMDASEFQALVNNTTGIANRNRHKLMSYYNQPVITDEFLFLRKYMNKNQFPQGTWDKEFVKISEPS